MPTCLLVVLSSIVLTHDISNKQAKGIFTMNVLLAPSKKDCKIGARKAEDTDGQITGENSSLQATDEI